MDYTPYPCPEGHYCPNGTEWATQYGCPAGTYNPYTQLRMEDQCTPCDAGKFCSGVGKSNVSGDCAERYWCISGASSATPIDGSTGQLCPEGHFCPSGEPNPLQCPLGTWSNMTGLATALECLPCSGGFYCNGTGLTEPSGPCDAKYYCISNATTPTPTDGVTGDVCTAAHYCPQGTADPLPCELGTFMLNTHADMCDECPPGYYCITGSTPEHCPAGYYCPAGTGIVWESCPSGTFSSSTGLANETQCTPCSGGHYCSELNGTTVTGSCDPGYYCTSGSDTPSPDGMSNKGTAGPCPTGHYCPVNSTVPSPCLRGTYSNVTHLEEPLDCEPCDYGMYCGEEGLTEPSGQCWAGFYCLRGADSPNNPMEDATGGPCPIGHYCLNRTSYPLGCEAGTYNPSTGMSACTDCPANYFCPENSTQYASNPCVTGHYCPIGTGAATDFPCDRGYYNNYTGKGSVDDCIPCEPGMFCGTSGLTYPSGPCAPGWYCARAAWSERPTAEGNLTDTCFCADNSTGGKCQPGEYCPEGSSEPLPCPAGKFYAYHPLLN